MTIIHDTIAFDEATHTYRVRGQIVPGVTSILQPLVDFSGIPPAVLAAKADLGTRVHLACELDDQDDLDEASVEDDVAPYLAAYRRFRAEVRPEILLNEHRVYHKTWNYCGTLDRVMRIQGLTYVVDLKTCFTTPMSAGPQTSAYARAVEAAKLMDIHKRAALRLRPDGTYRLDTLDHANDWSVFLACLTLRSFMENHRNDD